MVRLHLDLERASSASAKLLAAFNSPRSPTSANSANTHHSSSSSPYSLSASRPYSSSSFSRRKSESDSNHHHHHHHHRCPAPPSSSHSRHSNGDRHGHSHSGHLIRHASASDEHGSHLPPRSPMRSHSSSSMSPGRFSATSGIGHAERYEPGSGSIEISPAEVAGSSPGSDILGPGSLAARMLSATTEELFEIPEIGVPPEFAEMWVASHTSDDFSVQSSQHHHHSLFRGGDDSSRGGSTRGSLVCQCEPCRQLAEEAGLGETVNACDAAERALESCLLLSSSCPASIANPGGVSSGLAAYLLDAPVEFLFDGDDVAAAATSSHAGAAGGDCMAFPPPGEGSCTSGWMAAQRTTDSALLAAEGAVAAALGNDLGDVSLHGWREEQQSRCQWSGEFSERAPSDGSSTHRSSTMRAPSPARSSPAHPAPTPPMRTFSVSRASSPWRHMGAHEWGATASPAAAAEWERKARGRAKTAEQAVWNAGRTSVSMNAGMLMAHQSLAEFHPEQYGQRRGGERGGEWAEEWRDESNVGAGCPGDAGSGSEREPGALAHSGSAGSTLEAPFYLGKGDGSSGSSSHGSGRSADSSINESTSTEEPSSIALTKACFTTPLSQHVTSPEELCLRAELMRMEADLAWAQRSTPPSAMPPALCQQLVMMRREVDALRRALDSHALLAGGERTEEGREVQEGEEGGEEGGEEVGVAERQGEKGEDDGEVQQA